MSILIYSLSLKLPDVESMSMYIPAETTKIYSMDNVLLAELHKEENRIQIPLEKISHELRKTLIAVEDTSFYIHHGLNFKAIFRAMIRNVQAGSFVEGASTITQQLARNRFLHRRKKLIRKLGEMILAVKIERYYTKSEILEMYLNQVYWGHNAYGIESASQLYFGKKSINLSIAESSMLVGLLKGPELYTPFRNFEKAKQRQRTVLNRMVSLDLITQQQANDAYASQLQLSGRKKFKYKAPFFTSHVVNQLIDMFGTESTYTSGMKVYTTLDYKLQSKAEKVVKKYVSRANRPYRFKNEKVPSLNVNQGALLMLEPATGYIKVLQGGVNFKENEFNRITQAKRQPGSAFKPFVYLAALKKGFSPGSFFEDASVTYNTIEGPYAPQNYNKKFSGNIPMRKALERSKNVVAVKINHLVGPASVVQVARQIGIKSPLEPILSLPLGANEVTMLELATAYAVFANNGRRVEPTSILRIEDRDGIPLYEHTLKESKVFDENLIATLVDMMKGVVRYGTGKNANLPRPTAGKTGTTSDYRDAWFFGFIPQMVCAAWVGNDDNSPMVKMTGGWLPALMWRDIMKTAVQNIIPQDFPSPRGLVTRKVDWDSTALANEFSPASRVSIEKYWKGKAPKEENDFSNISKYNRKKKEGSKDQIIDFFTN